jgi:predicted PurR-regulated permease PerM
VVEESINAISSSLIGNVAISLVAATVAGLTAWALGLPFPIVLAVPFAAVIKIVLREAGAPRRARMASLREATVAETERQVTPTG